MVYALGAQKWNAEFVKTAFTSQRDFTVVLYSATNRGLHSNNQFHFQGNTVKVNHVREKYV
jgi:hypothetical protein